MQFGASEATQGIGCEAGSLFIGFLKIVLETNGK